MEFLKNKTIVFFTVITVCILIFIYIFQVGTSKNKTFLGRDEPLYTSKMRDVFGDAYYDLFEDHNQFLDGFFELIRTKKLDDSSKILVIVDYHSDIYKNNYNIDHHFEGVGNWVNRLMNEINKKGDGLVDEIYWVLPDSTMSKNQNELYWGREEFDTKQTLISGLIDVVIYADKTGRLYFDNPNRQDFREIKIHKRLLSEMPSFAENTKQIILTIDADYFIYNGFEAFFKTPEPGLSETNVNEMFEKMVDRFAEIKLKPVFVGCSESPEYTVNEYRWMVEKFFRFIAIYSKTGTDYLIKYHRNYNEDETSNLNNLPIVTRQSVPGSNVEFDLESVDITSENPNKKIHMSKKDKKYEKALQLLTHNQKIPELVAWLEMLRTSEFSFKNGFVINLSY